MAMSAKAACEAGGWLVACACRWSYAEARIRQPVLWSRETRPEVLVLCCEQERERELQDCRKTGGRDVHEEVGHDEAKSGCQSKPVGMEPERPLTMDDIKVRYQGVVWKKAVSDVKCHGRGSDGEAK